MSSEPSEHQMQAGVLIREARKARKWNQTRLAAVVEEEFRRRGEDSSLTCEQSTVSSWEKGKKRPQPAWKVTVLEDVLGLDRGELTRLYFDIDTESARDRVATPRELVARMRRILEQLDRHLPADPVPLAAVRTGRARKQQGRGSGGSPRMDTQGNA